MLGTLVRRERARLGLSQAALAARVGCTPKTIWRIEHVPRARPQVRIRHRLALALGLSREAVEAAAPGPARARPAPARGPAPAAGRRRAGLVERVCAHAGCGRSFWARAA